MAAPAPESSLARRSRTTLVDEVVDAVRDRIVRGELGPGLRIPQQALAETLGVSRTPLREAFQRLEADGWVRLRARRGAEVRPLTATEAEGIFGMRVVLETAAARLAAATHGEDDERRARALVARDPRCGAPAPDLDGPNGAFHAVIYGLDSDAIPRELAAAVRRYWARGLRYRLVYWSRPASAGRSHEAHLAILEAWSRRDPVATERAVARHILTALWQITARIEPGRPPSAALRALAERHLVAPPTPQPEER
jgi:DNA-binding GntR family transcriptional regulator